MIPHPPSPSPAPGPFPASKPFPMVRRRPPNRSPDADGGTGRHVQRHMTAAGRGNPLVYELPYAVLMPGNRTGIPSLESNISRFHVRFNAKSRPEQRFSRRFRHFSRHVQVCCTSFDAPSQNQSCRRKHVRTKKPGMDLRSIPGVFCSRGAFCQVRVLN